MEIKIPLSSGFFQEKKKNNGGGGRSKGEETETTFKIVTSDAYSFPHINSLPRRTDLITR